MPKKGGKRRKRRTHVEALRPEAAANAPQESKQDSKDPKSFVIRKGKVGKNVLQLVQDLRMLMSPNTATRLKERKKASVKDYVHVAAQLGVTHMLVFGQSGVGPTLRIGRLPQGPTLTFRLQKYSLVQHVRNSQKRPVDAKAALHAPPLVVLNNFNCPAAEGKRHLKVVMLTFQAMFPAINVKTVNTSQCKRVVLIHYVPKKEGVEGSVDTFELRHYLVKAAPRGISRNVKKILRSRGGVPNLGEAEDISEYVLGKFKPKRNASSSSGGDGGYATSDSEFEGDEDDVVTLPSGGKGSKRMTQSYVKLKEIGPRLSMELLKVEDGVFTGEVQYHAYLNKTAAQEEATRQMHVEKAKLKAERKLIQAENIKRKLEVIEAKKKKKAEKRKKREKEREEQQKSYPEKRRNMGSKKRDK